MTDTTNPADIKTDIRLQVPDLNLDNIYHNSMEAVLSGELWVSFLIIIASFFVGALVRKIVRGRLIELIDRQTLSYRINQILKNITKLTFQVGAMAFISFAHFILPILISDIDISPLTAALKLFLAWVFIRIVAQIIENTFMRQIIALFAWVMAALSILGVMEETQRALDAIGMDFGDWRLSLLTLSKFMIALVILLGGTRILVNVAERNLQRATDLSPSVRVLLVKIIKITLISLAILIGVTAAGINLSALAIFGGALGLGIGFGLQKVISNLFSGMLLLMDKSIKPGDIIELPDGTGAFGWVSQLGARYVSLITRDNKEYLIPNEDFITQPVINWSYSDRKIRVETKFGVAYSSDPHQVKALAIEVASNVKRVVSDPKPVCHLVEFGDSSLRFVLRYWIEDAENGVTNTKGDVMLGLWDAFKENGIEIPFPHRVLIQKN